jgi:ABC-2 type transport system ATP-binding protein
MAGAFLRSGDRVVRPRPLSQRKKGGTIYRQARVALRREAGKVSAAIFTSELTKRFARTSGYRDLLPFRKRQWATAVERVNLEIHSGEFFGLLGPNGAGKTTLIKLLCCLVLPTSGTASIYGNDILKKEQTVKKLVGLVNAEERSFYWRLTGRENLNFYASLYHLPRYESRQRINELLNVVGLDKDADIRFQNYSTGMRQKMAIIRGLLSEPKVLFVDEPTRSLDHVSAQSVRSFLKEKVVVEKKTIVLATHNLTEAEQLCDRVAIMDHGQIITMGSVKKLRSIFQTYEKCRLQVRNFPESVLSQLAHIEGVLACNLTRNDNEGPTLELNITNHEQVLPRLLQIIINNGAEVYNCQLQEMPLQEIFTYALKSGLKREE